MAKKSTVNSRAIDSILDDLEESRVLGETFGVDTIAELDGMVYAIEMTQTAKKAEKTGALTV